jgi:L-ascorbate metabolism protein UlaG (beta-lactamase superfamily)
MQSDHFDGKHFFSPGSPPIATWKRVLRWWTSRRDRGHWPRWVKVKPVRPVPPSETGKIALTWVNHSTFLIQTPEGNFITDPVYSRRAGPFGIVGPKRVHAPGVALGDLPKIDFVLLSHDHYDHCDIATLRYLARRDAPLAVTLLGNAPLLRRAGYRRILELDWWDCADELAAPGASARATVTATPAQHWSNRLTGKRNSRLWGGFWINAAGRSLYFAGDTGYRERIFQEIRRRLGTPDMAMLPIGAYHPRWFMSPQHCDPVEAVRIHCDLGARRSVAMHWGCFRLTDEERGEPPRELGRAREAAGLAEEAFAVLAPGETVEF